MPVRFPLSVFARRAAFGAAFALLFAGFARAAPSVGVAVLHSAEWSPGDNVRDGAGEFAVHLRVAQLQREHRAAGLVSVGDHNGLLRSGGERALRRVVLTGVPVVKLARGGSVAPDPETLFLDAGTLDEARATRVLTRCLELYGAPPIAADPEHPTAGELTVIRAHLRRFQEMFARENTPLVAMQ